MPYRQLVQPNLSASRPAGWCLAFAQDVYGAPVRYRSAWDAWQAIPDKKFGALPDVSVCVWMSHWGTYQGEYANWGHVVAYVVGRGFLSSPARGVGQQWFDTLAAVERTFNAKTVGWSESINGLQVVEWYEQPTPKPSERKKNMILVTFEGTTYLVGAGFISIAPDQVAVDALTIFYGGNHNIKLATSWPVLCRANGIPKGVPRDLKAKLGEFAVPCWSEARGFFDSGVSL